MSTNTSTPSLDLVTEMVEAKGEVDCNGLLLIQWEENNSVSARYAGTELSAAGVLTLATNGLQALVASLSAPAPAPESEPLTIVKE
jgi:hypothetical protein|tara:strand:+ start:73 stop:330 length:258 start_codon:yes stop_codon:yes gene_type:complete